MFRKPGAKRSLAARQRKADSSGEGSSDDAEIVKDSMAKRRRKNPMVQSTKKEDKSRTATNASSSSSSDEREDEFAFKASGGTGPAGPRDMGATATLDIETEKEKDARSQFERVQKELESADGSAIETDAEGRPLYRGLAMYGAKKAKETAMGNAGSGSSRLGPVRAPQFLRQTVRWDFAPDICKDYKETGFCTFGDSCKFMHDRGDYKHGWELERDFEQGKAEAEKNYEISDDNDGFPDCCPVCEGDFVDPVVTRCSHYFCERCAISAFKKSKKCRVCEQNTGGVFNIAKELIAHMKGDGKKKKKAKEREESRMELSEDDEDKIENMKLENAEGEVPYSGGDQEQEQSNQEKEIKREIEDSGEDSSDSESPQSEKDADADEEVAIDNEIKEDEDGGESGADDDEDYDEGESPNS